ncbi:hypothetical protein AN644_04975 [Candidatus Epulonipiscium fishelsonii]|nr:hypothetical protein AN644_04975 [Epulopiscium sp. SCG-C06WGA-EpuloA1]
MKLLSKIQHPKLLSCLFVGLIGIGGIVNAPNFISSFSSSIKENKTDIQWAFSRADAKYAENFVSKQGYIDLNGALANLIGQKVLNDVIKLSNGHLTMVVDKLDMEPYVENITDFKKYLDEKEIPLLYIQAPHKLPTDMDENLPKDIITYPNRNADELLLGLNQNNISTLDLREKMKEDKIDYNEAFYKTDHHWTFETGFWAHTKILEQINEILDIDVVNKEAIDINNYHLTTYENAFLGSRGNRVGSNFTEPDDITTILPKFETNFILEIPRQNIKREGEFKDTLIFDKTTSDVEIDLNLDAQTHSYSYYLGGDNEYLKITNAQAPINKRIFLIKDSFNIPMTPFLAMHYKEVHTYDMRDGNGGSINKMLQKLEEVNPDMLLAMYYPGAFREETLTFLN